MRESKDSLSKVKRLTSTSSLTSLKSLRRPSKAISTLSAAAISYTVVTQTTNAAIVDVKLRTNWDHVSAISEHLEFLKEISPTTDALNFLGDIFNLSNKGSSNGTSSRVSSADAEDIAESYLHDKNVQDFLDIITANHYYSPRIEMLRSVSREHKARFDNRVRSKQCSIFWLLYPDGSIECNVDEMKKKLKKNLNIKSKSQSQKGKSNNSSSAAAAESESESEVTMYNFPSTDFDLVIKQKSENLPTAIVYADLGKIADVAETGLTSTSSTSSSSAEFWNFIINSEGSDSNENSLQSHYRIIFRHSGGIDRNIANENEKVNTTIGVPSIPDADGADYDLLAGYGIRLRIKNTEYKASADLDDDSESQEIQWSKHLGTDYVDYLKFVEKEQSSSATLPLLARVTSDFPETSSWLHKEISTKLDRTPYKPKKDDEYTEREKEFLQKREEKKKSLFQKRQEMIQNSNRYASSLEEAVEQLPQEWKSEQEIENNMLEPIEETLLLAADEEKKEKGKPGPSEEELKERKKLRLKKANQALGYKAKIGIKKLREESRIPFSQTVVTFNNRLLINPSHSNMGIYPILRMLLPQFTALERLTRLNQDSNSSDSQVLTRKDTLGLFHNPSKTSGAELIDFWKLVEKTYTVKTQAAEDDSKKEKDVSSTTKVLPMIDSDNVASFLEAGTEVPVAESVVSNTLNKFMIETSTTTSTTSTSTTSPKSSDSDSDPESNESIASDSESQPKSQALPLTQKVPLLPAIYSVTTDPKTSSWSTRLESIIEQQRQQMMMGGGGMMGMGGMFGGGVFGGGGGPSVPNIRTPLSYVIMIIDPLVERYVKNTFKMLKEIQSNPAPIDVFIVMGEEKEREDRGYKYLKEKIELQKSEMLLLEGGSGSDGSSSHSDSVAKKDSSSSDTDSQSLLGYRAYLTGIREAVSRCFYILLSSGSDPQKNRKRAQIFLKDLHTGVNRQTDDRSWNQIVSRYLLQSAEEEDILHGSEYHKIDEEERMDEEREKMLSGGEMDQDEQMAQMMMMMGQGIPVELAEKIEKKKQKKREEEEEKAKKKSLEGGGEIDTEYANNRIWKKWIDGIPDVDLSITGYSGGLGLREALPPVDESETAAAAVGKDSESTSTDTSSTTKKSKKSKKSKKDKSESSSPTVLFKPNTIDEINTDSSGSGSGQTQFSEWIRAMRFLKRQFTLRMVLKKKSQYTGPEAEDVFLTVVYPAVLKKLREKFPNHNQIKKMLVPLKSDEEIMKKYKPEEQETVTAQSVQSNSTNTAAVSLSSVNKTSDSDSTEKPFPHPSKVILPDSSSVGLPVPATILNGQVSLGEFKAFKNLKHIIMQVNMQVSNIITRMVMSRNKYFLKDYNDYKDRKRVKGETSEQRKGLLAVAMKKTMKKILGPKIFGKMLQAHHHSISPEVTQSESGGEKQGEGGGGNGEEGGGAQAAGGGSGQGQSGGGGKGASSASDSGSGKKKSIPWVFQYVDIPKDAIFLSGKESTKKVVLDSVNNSLALAGVSKSGPGSRTTKSKSKTSVTDSSTNGPVYIIATSNSESDLRDSSETYEESEDDPDSSDDDSPEPVDLEDLEEDPESSMIGEDFDEGDSESRKSSKSSSSDSEKSKKAKKLAEKNSKNHYYHVLFLNSIQDVYILDSFYQSKSVKTKFLPVFMNEELWEKVGEPYFCSALNERNRVEKELIGLTEKIPELKQKSNDIKFSLPTALNPSTPLSLSVFGSSSNKFSGKSCVKQAANREKLLQLKSINSKLADQMRNQPLRTQQMKQLMAKLARSLNDPSRSSDSESDVTAEDLSLTSVLRWWCNGRIIESHTRKLPKIQSDHVETLEALMPTLKHFGANTAAVKNSDSDDAAYAQINAISNQFYNQVSEPVSDIDHLWQVFPESLRMEIDNTIVDNDKSITTASSSNAPVLKIAALVDPLSDTMQQLSQLLVFLYSVFPVQIRFMFNPASAISEVPLREYYREVIYYGSGQRPAWDIRSTMKLLGGSDSESTTAGSESESEDSESNSSGDPESSSDSEDSEVSRASKSLHALTITRKNVLTLALEVPPTWLVSAVEARADFDNLAVNPKKDMRENSGKITKVFSAEYALESLYMEGQALMVEDEHTWWQETPTGVVELGLYEQRAVEKVNSGMFDSSNSSTSASMTTNWVLKDDARVLQNHGYFQLAANPGMYSIRLLPETAKRYELVSAPFLTVDSYLTPPYQIRVKDNPNNLLDIDDGDEGGGGAMQFIQEMDGTMRLIPGSGKKKKKKSLSSSITSSTSSTSMSSPSESTSEPSDSGSLAVTTSTVSDTTSAPSGSLFGDLFGGLNLFGGPTADNRHSGSRGELTDSSNGAGLTIGKSDLADEIHIFTVASGHLYEKLMSIMILSVRRHTKSKLHFWFIDTFLSPRFKNFLPTLAYHHNFRFDFVSYKWPSWLNPQHEKQRVIWAYKILFLDLLFPLDVKKIIFIDSDQIVRADVKELVDLDMGDNVYGFTPMGDSNQDTEGFRFWKQGYWKNHLQGKPYHISALFVVDLEKYRALTGGDTLRSFYNQLSRSADSLSNLDQDLPNFAQHQLPIFSLPKEWLWCETWCASEELPHAKTIDLCQNPLTKEPKLKMAQRIAPEWIIFHDMVVKLQEEFESGKYNYNTLNSNSTTGSSAGADELLRQIKVERRDETEEEKEKRLEREKNKKLWEEKRLKDEEKAKEKEKKKKEKAEKKRKKLREKEMKEKEGTSKTKVQRKVVEEKNTAAERRRKREEQEEAEERERLEEEKREKEAKDKKTKGKKDTKLKTKKSKEEL